MADRESGTIETVTDDISQLRDDIVAWIRTYFAENGAGCTAVVGISGGKDSSVTAALCAEALGRERVLGVLMPDGEQPDIEDAQALVSHLGIPSLMVNIGDTTTALTAALESSPEFEAAFVSGALSRDSRINMPPRIRMTVLYAAAQSLPHGGRVANTCNASEDYVGYSTKFGDAAGDFSPLADIPVRDVKRLGRALGLPERLVDKTPSDGLSGMSDEDKLGFTYEQLDRYMETGICEDEAVRTRIDGLHALNLHKLLPMPTYRRR